jgi:DNA repair protein RAD16
MRWGAFLRRLSATSHADCPSSLGRMGKTIQTISLILSDYSPTDRKRTLVLAPTVAIIQWANEIAKFTEGMKVLIYHGQNRVKSVAELEKCDIILTSCT